MAMLPDLVDKKQIESRSDHFPFCPFFFQFDLFFCNDDNPICPLQMLRSSQDQWSFRITRLMRKYKYKCGVWRKLSR